MPFIRTISKKEATGKLKEIYDEWGFAASAPPADIFSVRPDLMENFMEDGLAHFRSPTPLPPRLRQLIVVAVSKANSCPFCFDAHSVMLQALGFSRSAYKKLIRDTEGAEMDDLTRQLSQFARKVTGDVAGISSADAENLRDALGDEGNFVEAVWTIALFNFINRVVNTLGVTLDFAFKSINAAFSIGLGRLHPLIFFVREFLKPRPEKFANINPEEILRETDLLYRETLGFSLAPPFYKALALRPIQMKAWADKARTYLRDGMLTLDTKMLIANLAGKLEGYDWLVQESTRWLEKQGKYPTAKNPLELVSDSQLDPRLQKILRLAQDITLHSYKITQKRIDELRGEGMKDEEILEAVGVTSLFNGESRLYKCLGYS